MLGMMKNNQGGYQQAVTFYEKSLEIKRKTLPEDDVSLAPTYGNIGLVYDNMGEYSKALEYYEKSLKIKEISLPPTHPNLAASYNNIGHSYEDMQEYSKLVGLCNGELKDNFIIISNLFLSVDLLLSFFCSRYSIMMLGMIGKWLRIKLGATYNYLIMFYCIRVSINNNKMYVHIDQQQ
ncbi:unnamed protein product [Rotaria socialis]|uniref:Uncharacterized protein n=2 Tax=Rotaria socialis TaxID=392032 RepID=A0A817YNG5_9BILA|nr:unnamed protein product [Rotaria socialis]